MPIDFSIVTVSLNSAATISDTVCSVRDQADVTVEHIIKDAGSQDGTVELAKHVNPRIRVVVCPDNGIYDAMNQGFSHCKGEIVGFLNSDDYYAAPCVLEKVLRVFRQTGCDLAYGDIDMVNGDDVVIRKWKAGALPIGSLGGKQIPHPALFVRRSALARLDGPFDSSYRISADLKQQLLLIERMHLVARYLPQTITIMRAGGESTRNLKMVFLGWSECARAYREVHGRSGWIYVARKVLSKFQQIRISPNITSGNGENSPPHPPGGSK